jgi:hypothetical protein
MRVMVEQTFTLRRSVSSLRCGYTIESEWFDDHGAVPLATVVKAL